MKTGLIYKYTNKINGKVYIGQTKTSLEKRRKKHLTQLNDKTYFHRALKKYGENNFDIEIIESDIPLNLLDEKEIYYIKIYDSFFTSGKGYNLTKGGQWGSPIQKVSGSAEKEIKKLIKESEKTFKEIGNIFNVSDSCICDINRGRTFYDPNLNYPLRPSPEKSIIVEDMIYDIILDLMITDMSAKEIADKYNIKEYTVGEINRGNSSYCPKDIDYPLRNWEQNFTYNNILTKKNVISICRDLIFSKETLEEIGIKYGVAKGTINDISRGVSWKIITSKLKLPIRKNKEFNKKIYKDIV